MLPWPNNQIRDGSSAAVARMLSLPYLLRYFSRKASYFVFTCAHMARKKRQSNINKKKGEREREREKGGKRKHTRASGI